jgi:Uma2 family endonuclease
LKNRQVPEIIFEIVSPSTGRRDETIKFELYQKEGVGYYVLVYPDGQVAKVYRFNEIGKYVKVGDFDNETIEFETKKCRFDFDFSKIWQQ